VSKHTFTVVVECDDSDEYEKTVMDLSAIGEITYEESDF
jgi:hypothetical protein